MQNANPVVGETFSHYRVLDRLGSGGMGDVYRAEDLRLRRIVALKTLRSTSVDDDSARRLLAEARAASSLNHPNIAVVYEINEAVDSDYSIGYIAMEYVEGTTVAALLERGPLDVDLALDIVIQTADALVEAHAQGLVHRDLKPSNLMITAAGRVKVLDFGVAQRRGTSPATPDDATRTAELPEIPGGFVGTLPYVSPEQATGRQVDGRADMFSLGVVLYELIAGTPPFSGANAAQMLEGILREAVPPIRNPERDPRIPELEPVIRRMLARDPDARFASLAEVRDALATVQAGGHLRELDSGEGRSVAVAGFINISGNPEDDWLGAGISETLTADAGQIEGVSIISRERVSEILKTLSQQTGEQGDRLFLRAARELQARWLVSGAFQRSGDAVRVTASVIDVVSGQLMGTTKVDGSLRAIFDVQDRLVRDLAAALRAAVAPPSVPVQETNVVEAYEAFSRGLLNRTEDSFESLDRAVWLFERAVALDPAYARAYVELGAAYSTKADYLSLGEVRRRAVTNLRRAVDLQPSFARAWRELGSVLVADGQIVEGMSAIRRALELDAEDASACAAMGRALFVGYAQFSDAAVWFKRALERNAKGGWYALQLAHCAALLRDFAEGERAARTAMELQEAFLSGREGLAIAGGYMRAGHLAALQNRPGQALEYFQREIDFLERTDHPLRKRILVELNARLGSAYLQTGDGRRAEAVFDVALQSFERRVRLGADDPFTRYYAAAVHALRDDAEPALAFLGRSVAEQRAFTIARARIEPEFDRLRSDPRFVRLLENPERRTPRA